MKHTLDEAKFANTVLYLLHGCGEDRPGILKLLKMLYFADSTHYRKHLRPITGATYVAIQMGPVPNSYKDLLSKLVQRRALQCVEVEINGFQKPKTEYRPLIASNERALSESEREVLDEVIAFCRHKSGTMLRDASHREGPWQLVWDPDHQGSPIPYPLMRWLDNFCDDEDVSQARRAMDDPDARAVVAALTAGS